MQTYACPVVCELGSTEWFPCGASSAVAIAASVFGTSVVVHGDAVYVDGALLEPALSRLGDSRSFSCAECPGNAHLEVRRIADDDPSYRSPGPKLSIMFGDGPEAVDIATWRFDVVHMPTGYLHNARLSLPAEIEVSGLCTESIDTSVGTPPDQPTPAWGGVSGPVLEPLMEQCGSFTGEYTPIGSPSEMCSQTGLAYQDAQLHCAHIAGLHTLLA